jgi:hypothetical protein
MVRSSHDAYAIMTALTLLVLALSSVDILSLNFQFLRP